MATTLNYFCYFAVLSLCIDHGQGRWKMSTRERLEHDIDTFRKMSDKIRKEIEEFYTKNPDATVKNEYHNIEKMREKYTNWNKEIPHKIQDNTANSIPTIQNLTLDTQTTKEMHGNYKSEKRVGQDLLSWENIDSNRMESHWPKFDDILLAMGKMYDWKNDRWIKVKERKKQTASSVVDRIAFLSKHRFSYRSVRFNKSKTKRKLVIAVSAIT